MNDLKNISEIWRDIPGFEKVYQVSNLGRVKSLSRYITPKVGKPYKVEDKLLKLGVHTGGYLTVSLRKEGRYFNKYVHRLVLLTFSKGVGETVNHIDGDKKNNTLENLEWATYRSNLLHAKELKLNNNHGEGHWNNTKLNWDKVNEIRRLKSCGKYTNKEIAKKFDISPKYVGEICTNKKWKNKYFNKQVEQ